VATDRRGRFLLSAYYQAGHCAVHPIDERGALGGAAIEWRKQTPAPSFRVDPTNRFAFAPHIAQSPGLPSSRRTGANAIFQFTFARTHRPADTQRPPLKPAGGGPRHFAFHPSKPLLYVDNEQTSSVTVSRSTPKRHADAGHDDGHPAGRVHGRHEPPRICASTQWPLSTSPTAATTPSPSFR
jgi:6-phosphogluconolactonase